MKSFIFLLLSGIMLSTNIYGGSSTVNQLIEQSCQGLENCKIEGMTASSQGKPINEIIYNMCQIQLTKTTRVDCYEDAYSKYLRSAMKDLTKKETPSFSNTMIKSYFHYVQKNCLDIPASSITEWESSSVRCWAHYSLNMEIELQSILLEMKAGTVIPIR